jgi:hypothetical protein
MFKKLLQRIIDAENVQDAVDNVLYGMDGVDMAYQRDKITFKEHEILFKLVSIIADGYGEVRA